MSPRRQRLYDAAADLFVRYGFRKTSIDDLTRAAGVSKGAFYLEFTNKQDLFQALIRHRLVEYLTDVNARIAADPDGGRLSRIYRHSIGALLPRPFLVALYTQPETILPTVLRDNGPATYAPRIQLGADFLERMQAAGLIRADVKPDVVSHTLGVLTVGPLLAAPVLRDDQAPSIEETFTTLASMIVASLEAPGGDVAAGKQAFADLTSQLCAALSEPDTTGAPE